MRSETERAYQKAYRAARRDKLKAYSKEWYKKNRDRQNRKSRQYHRKHRVRLRQLAKAYYHANKEYARDSFLKRKYGITLEVYKTILFAQGGVCAICKRAPKGALCVDHDHKAKAVRGLLCHNCNHAIGQFKEDEETLSRAIEYLRKSKPRPSKLTPGSTPV